MTSAKAIERIQSPAASEHHHRYFTGPFTRRVLPRVGHNPPQEAPRAVADAVLELGVHPK